MDSLVFLVKRKFKDFDRSKSEKSGSCNESLLISGGLGISPAGFLLRCRSKRLFSALVARVSMEDARAVVGSSVEVACSGR